MKNKILLLLIVAISQQVVAQHADLKLVDWDPKSQLVVHETKILKPKYPVIDIHNHLGKLENTEHYLEEMDKAGVWMTVSLDGLSKDNQYKEHLKKSQRVSAERLLVFFRPDFERIDEPNWGQNEAKKLEKAVKEGIRGIKISKRLGLGFRDESGELIKVDDPRIDPFWAKCGELQIPIVIHVSDPKAFFEPIDKHNERYDELGAHPDWSFYGDEFPSKDEILAARNRVIARHPKTIFIGAHMGTLPEELHQVANWLELYPNFYVDIDARISELGRQPNTARKFLIKYQDRVMFGSDTPCDAAAYRIYYRWLETDDEYINPAQGHHLQGRWMIYGINLPDEVLEKIYNKNALKVLNLVKVPKG
ncbi:MAG: amidohydrolase family protein [Reichenbachiella sp.]|uniref:amidohydrolase family protein n=1 Tax=Reichenbachiella sp. TaxID=2184521 RepID=UPI0032977852